MTAGFGWVHLATQHAAPVHTGAWPLVPGLIVAGAGLGFLIIPLANIVLSAVPAHLAGGASGIFTTAQQFGDALIGNVFFNHAGQGLTRAVDAAGPWAIGAYLACTLLCFALPRKTG